ncbi:MAG: lytic murein transglycosylase, partial [Gammaproteobacteria bacterium]|nr:lytic murein transglycosylase [Gammaproteobacteria bacterium]
KNGVTTSRILSNTRHANLIRLRDKDGYEFWLAFDNFYVITKYNNSIQYAMAVYQLAQQLQTGYSWS